MIERPVARLAASSDELVGIKDHDLVFVGLVYENAVNSRLKKMAAQEQGPLIEEQAEEFWTGWKGIFVIVIFFKVPQADADKFGSCFNTCEQECMAGGQGQTFCEMKCDTDCFDKEVAAKLNAKVP
ncbi:hypothetical protein GH714_003638 [Hevea brasiliensis]|uniref:Uncharacterized protein n=1 Tax=Hevea brasiliensis TaxID=3981 RepID=A0A6A6KBD7_HEVBR|nr:hypothetical protein GH714_003638 [Hevea brasiliensis]